MCSLTADAFLAQDLKKHLMKSLTALNTKYVYRLRTALHFSPSLISGTEKSISGIYMAQTVPSLTKSH